MVVLARNLDGDGLAYWRAFALLLHFDLCAHDVRELATQSLDHVSGVLFAQNLAGLRFTRVRVKIERDTRLIGSFRGREISRYHAGFSNICLDLVFTEEHFFYFTHNTIGFFEI